MADGLDIQVRLEGFDRLTASLRGLQVGQRTRAFLDATGHLVVSEARRRAPVNVGLLRASIFHEVDGNSDPRWVDVGSNQHYAPYMEYGTGLTHDHPSWPKVRHIPFVNRDEENGRPVGALFYWAKRKGMGFAGGWGVARAIARRGGLRPRRFLRGPIEDLKPRINDNWRLVLDGIRNDLAGGGQA